MVSDRASSYRRCGKFCHTWYFFKNSVSLVAEDYYKKGKGINIDISKQNSARDLSLSANVSTSSNRIIIDFDKGELEHFPALVVTFSHRTLADRDFSQTLSANALYQYAINLDNEIEEYLVC